MTIEQMADEARKTVFQHINRSAGQHSRAMQNAKAPTSADLYAIGMESDTAYRLMPWLCRQAGISFPPVNE
jgi:hypothetical protein